MATGSCFYVEAKEQNKQNRNKPPDAENILGVARWGVCEQPEGIRKYKLSYRVARGVGTAQGTAVHTTVITAYGVGRVLRLSG